MEEMNKPTSYLTPSEEEKKADLEVCAPNYSNIEKFDEKLSDTSESAKKVPIVKKACGKVKSAVVTLGTRTVVVACSVLLIGLAVILNFALSPTGAEPSGDIGQTMISSVDDTDMYREDTYFASSVLSREKARDEAIDVLKTVVNNEATLEDAREAALMDIARIADAIECEANIETLIKSKGFEECIAVVTGTNANVIVKSDGLMPNELSQIKEIVYEQAGVDPINIKIVEKN